MIRFAKPNINKKTYYSIKKIINSGNFLHGEFTYRFENKLSNFFNLKKNKLLTTASCTAALHLYYLAIGLKKGDEVIMSAQTHVATAHAVEVCGAKPVFVDCELQTGNIDIKKIEKKISKKTVCICVTHFLGRPANMSEIIKLKKKYNLKLVEDTALSIGSKIGKKFSGTFGDAGAFSFHPVKIMTTGEGGALILKKERDFWKIKSLKSFGYDEASPGKRKIPGNYNINFCGLNYRMNEIESAIGEQELKDIKKKIELRKKNYNYLFKELKKSKNFTILDSRSDKNIKSSYYALTIILNKKKRKNRNKIILNLKKSGIQTSIYYPHPVPLLNYYKKKYKYKNKDFYNSSRIAYDSITLPVGPHIIKKDINHMVKTIEKIIG